MEQKRVGGLPRRTACAPRRELAYSTESDGETAQPQQRRRLGGVVGRGSCVRSIALELGTYEPDVSLYMYCRAVRSCQDLTFERMQLFTFTQDSILDTTIRSAVLYLVDVHTHIPVRLTLPGPQPSLSDWERSYASEARQAPSSPPRPCRYCSRHSSATSGICLHHADHFSG